MKIADIFLEDKSLIKDTNKIIGIQLDKEYLGKYCNEEGLLCELIDSTRSYINFNWGLEEMIPLTDSSFTIFQGQVIVKFNKKIKIL